MIRGRLDRPLLKYDRPGELFLFYPSLPLTLNGYSLLIQKKCQCQIKKTTPQNKSILGGQGGISFDVPLWGQKQVCRFLDPPTLDHSGSGIPGLVVPLLGLKSSFMWGQASLTASCSFCSRLRSASSLSRRSIRKGIL